MKRILYLSLLITFSVSTYAQDKKAGDLPYKVLTAFKNKFPEGTVGTWKSENNNYLINFTNDGMTGVIKYSADTAWIFTKYNIPDKELPGPAITDFKSNYFGYKIKTSQLVEQPDSTDHYYVFAKKDGYGQPSVELFYSLTGKLIRKLQSDTKESSDEAVNDTGDDNDDKIKNTTEYVNTKDLPSSLTTYVKKNYYGYSIKEALLSISDEGKYYFIKIKKEGKKAITELSFDINGKFIEEKNKKEEDEE